LYAGEVRSAALRTDVVDFQFFDAHYNWCRLIRLAVGCFFEHRKRGLHIYHGWSAAQADVAGIATMPNARLRLIALLIDRNAGGANMHSCLIARRGSDVDTTWTNVDRATVVALYGKLCEDCW
jgi:hypothetical protein